MISGVDGRGEPPASHRWNNSIKSATATPCPFKNEGIEAALKKKLGHELWNSSPIHNRVASRTIIIYSSHRRCTAGFTSKHRIVSLYNTLHSVEWEECREANSQEEGGRFLSAALTAKSTFSPALTGGGGGTDGKRSANDAFTSFVRTPSSSFVSLIHPLTWGGDAKRGERTHKNIHYLIIELFPIGPLFHAGEFAFLKKTSLMDGWKRKWKMI
ncbi:hypothetical protein CDAR_206441 [Caerostris darwini]|uniref:Uncharacterized protein n=1 Tax=Caerostris darwini TaxID=1538125 RepID=A0AAV4PF69_9ARAC|nr:hypothetical protein CDAR_206441 [Caerostris darwini]